MFFSHMPVLISHAELIVSDSEHACFSYVFSHVFFHMFFLTHFISYIHNINIPLNSV